MNLFYLRPEGHGSASYYVLAASADAAALAINQERARAAASLHGGYFQDGWGGDNAVTPDQLSMASVGEVLTNDND